jgi:AMIN domain
MGLVKRIILPICAILLCGGLQLDGISGQVHTPATIIRHIDVTGTDHDLSVEISATRPVTPSTQVVVNPDRVIVDFQGALPAVGLHKVIVNRGNLTGVRVGLLSANPPVTRVVLDLISPTEFRVDSLGSKIFVKLGEESAAAPTPAPAAAITEPPAAATKTPAVSELSSNPVVVPNTPMDRSPERSRVRWILPILTIASVLALLVIALVSYFQNRQGSREL